MADKLTACKSCFDLWDNYCVLGIKSLPEEEADHKKEIDKTYKILAEMFQRYKPRNKNKMPAEDILKMHFEVVNDKSKPLFSLPIHRSNVAMMFHPHWGYLCKFNVINKLLNNS